MPRLTLGRPGPKDVTSQTPNMGIWDDLHVATWRGHPNIVGVFCSEGTWLVRPVCVQSDCLSAQPGLSSSLDAAVLELRRWTGVQTAYGTLYFLQHAYCNVVHSVPLYMFRLVQKKKISIRIHCTSVPFSLPTEINVLTLVHAVFLSYDTVNVLVCSTPSY